MTLTSTRRTLGSFLGVFGVTGIANALPPLLVLLPLPKELKCRGIGIRKVRWSQGVCRRLTGLLRL